MRKFVLFSIFLLLVVYCNRPEIPEAIQFEIRSVCSLPGYAKEIDMVGNLAYIADGQGGLQIIDVSNPDSTFVVGTYMTEREIQGVAVRDTFAYLAVGATNGGLMILNVVQPSDPVFVGQDPSFYAYNVVAPADDTMYVYIAARYWFHVEDVSYPEYPSFFRRFTTPGDIRGIYMVDSMVYLACEQMGIHIFNLAKPDSEAYVGWIDTPSNARNIFVRNNYAYVADGRAGLVIIDITAPETPQILSEYDTPEYANDIFIDGDYAYIADGEGGIQVIDITDPTAPELYGSIETSYAYGVYVRDDYIYVADRDMGLVIISEEE